MSNSVRRHFLKESKIKRTLDDLHGKLNVDLEKLFGPKPRIELVKTEETEILIHNKTPFLARTGDDVFPTLLSQQILPLLRKITVDMGAVPHICNGADIMAPGIIRVDGEFSENAFVLIVDERHGKPLAIGQALLNSESMEKTKRGRVVKNLHYVGDGVWNLIRKILA